MFWSYRLLMASSKTLICMYIFFSFLLSLFKHMHTHIRGLAFITIEWPQKTATNSFFIGGCQMSERTRFVQTNCYSWKQRHGIWPSMAMALSMRLGKCLWTSVENLIASISNANTSTTIVVSPVYLATSPLKPPMFIVVLAISLFWVDLHFYTVQKIGMVLILALSSKHHVLVLWERQHKNLEDCFIALVIYFAKIVILLLSNDSS